MQTVWSGFLSFGLVSIPVRMFVATESKSVSFNYVHRECGTPLKYQRVCPNCEEVVPWDDVARGFEIEKDKYVIMEEEDFEAIDLPSRKMIDIMQFSDLADIDSIYFRKSYYLAPEEGGEKAYNLLSQAMEKDGKIAIAKMVIRTKQHLCCIRRYQDSLLLETMFYHDEVRVADEVVGDTGEFEPREKEMKMARQLMESMSREFKAEDFDDDYRQAILKVINSKASGIKIETRGPPEGKPEDLVEALKQSIEAKQKG